MSHFKVRISSLKHNVGNLTNSISEGILFSTMFKEKYRENVNKVFALLKVMDRDKRYDPESYSFVMSALNFTKKRLKRKGHITGGELLHGIKDYAVEQFGPMARIVLKYWGITSTNDFGEIVFNMIDVDLLGKSEQDLKEDFDSKFDFEAVFDKDFKYTLH